ncbi:polycystic kidney disease 2-like 2 protein [Coccinella septempunctata]|uniref:polycystic kidney disease 2-like 2 protein n=1 Tax=Coccinella septempunctata TaxID=41139 RepID=UPI001D07EDF5|nr:polycystic kidney disease 2-like 2 protein [Coccinella septempunctata]
MKGSKSQEELASQFQNIGGQKSPEDVVRLKARLRDAYSDEISLGSQTEVKQNKPKKVRCITRAMAEDFSREQVLFSSLIETIFYIFFAITCWIHVANLKNSEMYYMTEAIKQGFFKKQFGGDDAEGVEPISFADIATVSDMWNFISKMFIDTIYYDKYFSKFSNVEDERGLSVLFENVLLGVPRIRQVRVAEDSCEIHPYFRRLFRLCFSSYDDYTEDKSTFGVGKETAWVYSDETVTENIQVAGAVATYNGGGFYLDLSLNGTEALKQVKYLEENLWITRNTRAVFLDFAVYNANLNIFGICKIIFELPPTGGVLPSHKFDCVKLIVTYDQWGYFIFICESVFYIFIFIYLLQSLRELVYFKWRYFVRFWSYIDCVITALALVTFILMNYKRNYVDYYITKIKENPDKYGNLEYIAYMQGLHDDIAAITLFFVFIRFFKYLNFNKTMGQLNDTLKKCTWDIMGFSIMFFIIFFAYSELGFLLFGSQVRDFRTFGHSMFTLLRTILGDFDYGVIEEAHRILAPIYFLSYIFLVFFVLLNMFLAIINDTYADVKTELAIAPTELQMTDYLKMHLFKFLSRSKCCKFKVKEIKKTDYSLTAEEIRTALDKCGFSYLEIEMFFARYNINPVAMVTEYDISKLVSELENITPETVTEKQKTPEAVKNTEELLQQKQQLKDMESTMFELASKIDELIKTLEKLNATHVTKKEESSESLDFY